MHRFFGRFNPGMARLRREARSASKARRALFSESGLFDHNWYLDHNPDVRGADQSPLDHFVEHGVLEWRDPGPDFDTAFYTARNPSFAKSGLSPFEH